MRARLVLLLAAAAIAALALSPAPAHAARPKCSKTKNVTVGDNMEGDLFFRPTRVTIRAGSCVRWIWAGMLDHELEGKGVDSPVRTAPYRYKKRYARARTRPFRIICTIHPLSMRMRVKVLPRASS